MFTVSLEPPSILHSYSPASEGVNSMNLRPRDPEGSNLVKHASLRPLLQAANRSCVVISECQDGLLKLSSHFWHVTNTPLLLSGLYKAVLLSGWPFTINVMPPLHCPCPSTEIVKPTQVLEIKVYQILTTDYSGL